MVFATPQNGGPAEARAGERPQGAAVAASPWLHSFVFAARGIGLAWRERNFRVQCAAGWAALAAALLAGLPAEGVGVLLAVVGAVLSAETMNSAVEVAVDLVVRQRHPLAAAAKDLAAGAVLLMSLGALATGVAVLRPLWSRPQATLHAIWTGHPLATLAAAAVEVALIGCACARAGRP
jgi:diacylglycerol kinase